MGEVLLDQYQIALKCFSLEKLDDKVRKRLQRLSNCLSKHIKNIVSLTMFLKKQNLCAQVIHGDPKLSNFLFDIHNKNVV